MGSDRSVQIIVAVIGALAILGAAWPSQRDPSPSPPARPEASISSDSTKEMLRHFAIKFSTDRQGGDYKDFDLPEDKYELCAGVKLP
jgi:hypothetical protein